MVLAGHLFVSASPSLADGILKPATTNVSTPAWLMLYTPLHVVWGGGEAVIVFFVLSGYVLTLPFARGDGFDATSYYPHRLVRLYLPVWGALCLAALVHAVVEGMHGADTWWLEAHTQTLTTDDVKQSVFLLDGAGTYTLLAVLWSLHWEVVFSLLLPLFLLTGRATRRFFPLAATLAIAVVYLRGTSKAADYLPAFMLGTLLAFQQARILEWRARLAREDARRIARMVEIALLAVAVLGLTGNWWIRVRGFALAGGSESLAVKLGPALVTLGASAAVVLATVGPVARRVLDRRPIQWAGARSYSLYLVHEVAIVAVVFALGGGQYTLLALPVAFAVTELFYRAIERPSHHLARLSGKRLAGRLRFRRA